MKRAGIWVIVIVIFMSGIVMPHQEQAESKTLAEIEKELEEVRAKMEEAQQNAAEAEQKVVEIQQQRDATRADLDKVIEEKLALEQQIVEKQNEIDQEEIRLSETEAELEEASNNAEARNNLLKSRLRLVYMNGSVSYLEVLLKSTSFADFLDRYDAVRALVGQDQDILDAIREEQERLEEKKDEVKQMLVDLAGQYDELTVMKSEYLQKEEQYKVLIAQLNAEEQHFEQITEEEQQRFLEESQRESELMREKKQLELSYYNGGELGFPLPLDSGFYKSSSYGYRIDPITGAQGAFHNGMDFAVAKGTDILAAEGGLVVRAGWYGSYGNCVMIDHGNGLMTLYAHASKVTVSPEDIVEKGDKIAEVGSTGRSTGNHLHFTVYLNGETVDPAEYINY